MIRISNRLYDDIVKYGISGMPEEVCGLIAGYEENGTRVITKVYYLENIDHSNEHFSMNPAEQFAAVKDMRKNSLVPLGNFHSHPESPSRPSDEDKRLAYDNKASYMILSLMDKNAPVLKSFRINGNDSEEEPVIRED